MPMPMLAPSFVRLCMFRCLRTYEIWYRRLIQMCIDAWLPIWIRGVVFGEEMRDGVEIVGDGTGGVVQLGGTRHGLREEGRGRREVRVRVGGGGGVRDGMG